MKQKDAPHTLVDTETQVLLEALYECLEALGNSVI